MGCAQGKQTFGVEMCEGIDSYVTPEEKELLRSSWNIVSQDISGVGMNIFKKLFDIETDLMKLFKRMLTKGETGQVVVDSIRLEGHATGVLRQIGLVVENMDNNSALTTTLIALGEVHANYRVRPEMLPLLWPAIRDALKIACEDEFTQQMELAWKHLYDFVTCHLSEGMVIAHLKGKRDSFVLSYESSSLLLSPQQDSQNSSSQNQPRNSSSQNQPQNSNSQNQSLME
ncbi:neuroglobin [Biomphalaria glabrata]|nr:neuroglobin-like [Biomphalaria glabrata]